MTCITCYVLYKYMKCIKCNKISNGSRLNRGGFFFALILLMGLLVKMLVPVPAAHPEKGKMTGGSVCSAW